MTELKDGIRIQRIICPFDHLNSGNDQQQQQIFMFQNSKSLLDHLEADHCIYIDDVDAILLCVDLYLSYYSRLLSSPTDVVRLGNDSELRKRIQQDKLNEILRLQQIERQQSDQFWICLFCKHNYSTRPDLLSHMRQEHSFHIGQSDNLVFVPELFETIREQMRALKCIYCEKVFRDGATLRRHMRKKKHFCLNPDNRDYDRFYLINYLEPGKKWTEIRYESDHSNKISSNYHRSHEEAGDLDEESSSGWSDWTAGSAEDLITSCLLCDHIESDAQKILQVHMPAAHNFHLTKMWKEFDVYKRIKLLNYIRRMTYGVQCFICRERFEGVQGLRQHFDDTDHSSRIPGDDDPFWNDLQYLLPTYEDDPLLMAVDDFIPPHLPDVVLESGQR